MEFGRCGTLDKAGDMAAARLDYIEVQRAPLELENDRAFADPLQGSGTTRVIKPLNRRDCIDT
jgi:hypothetical protein